LSNRIPARLRKQPGLGKLRRLASSKRAQTRPGRTVVYNTATPSPWQSAGNWLLTPYTKII
jgi:hypothetical protein